MSQQDILPFTIDNTGNLYYNNKDLKAFKPHFFYGFQSDPKHIIQRKNIPVGDYVFSCFDKKKGWTIYDNTCKRAQLLIKKSWVDRFYFNKIDTTPAVFVNNNSVFLVEEDEELIIEVQSQDLPQSQQQIEVAPNLLDLDDEDKFKDIDGKILEIETRGEKDRHNIFFKVKDVAEAFGMPRLQGVLTNIDRGYVRNLHYKNFITTTTSINDALGGYKKCLYLTYKGLLKVLFSSRTGNAEKFQDWAEDKLFVCQMGSIEEKEEVVSELMSIDVKNVRMMFDKKVFTFPCIYLLALGMVKDLRETFNIGEEVDGNSVVYKFGRTDNFERRLGEHQKEYGSMKNVIIKVVSFYYIDIKYLSDAEVAVNQLCNNFSKNLVFENYKELVLLNENELKQIKTYYKMLGELYIGATAGLQKQINDLTNDLIISNCKNESLEKDIKIFQKEIAFNEMQNKYELLLKQNELDEYKRSFH